MLDIDIWKISLQSSSVPIQDFQDFVTPYEFSKSQFIKSEELRKSYLRVRATLRKLLSLYLELPPLKIEFEKQKFGKPFIKTRFRTPPIEFNISHTNNTAVFAFAKEAIGIDIENVRPWNEWSTLTSLVYAKQERVRLDKIKNEKKAREFLRTWVVKEAFLKFSGFGINKLMSEIPIIFKQNQCITTIKPNDSPAIGQRIFTNNHEECWLATDQHFEFKLYSDHQFINDFRKPQK